MPKLITKADFLEYVPISKNLPDSVLAPYIQKALLMDVKPLLGELYHKVIVTEEQQLNGSEEDGLQDVDLVKVVWVHNAFIRFLPSHGIDIGSAGITKSRDTEGSTDHASPQERQALVASYRSTLNFWEGELGKALKKINGTGRPVKKRRIGLRVVGAKN